jgi:AraC-like DNA-binding protein
LEAENNFCNKLDHSHEYISLFTVTLDEIEEEFSRKREGYELMTKALLLKLLTLIIRYFKHSDEMIAEEFISPQITRKIKNTFVYIEEYYFRPLSISELAGIAQMSIPYFCAMFKALSGFPPMDYVINKRISAAKQALKCTDKKILDIAHECGYNTLSNFNHAFKVYTGISPSSYRKL